MGTHWLPGTWLWAGYYVAVGRWSHPSIMVNICFLVISEEMTEEQKQAANDAMYDHLDVFGWTKPARYFLSTHNSINEHTHSPEKLGVKND